MAYEIKLQASFHGIDLSKAMGATDTATEKPAEAKLTEKEKAAFERVRQEALERIRKRAQGG